MANESYLEIKSEVVELNKNVSANTSTRNYSDVQLNNEDFENVWKEPLNVDSAQDAKSKFLAYSPECRRTLFPGDSGGSDACQNIPAQTVSSSTNATKMAERQRGRVSLIRLQAVSPKDPTVECPTSTANTLKSSIENVSTLSSNGTKASYGLPGTETSVEKNPHWSSETCGKSESDNVPVAIPFPPTSHESSEPQGLISTLNQEAMSSSQTIQRFLTSEGQYVYGYKDSNGEFHFFYPSVDERESHNEKERKRRSRVSDACGALRKLVPGLSEKTDKASVFEQAARYLKFLRDKFGTQFDQIYYEKYFLDRS